MHELRRIRQERGVPIEVVAHRARVSVRTIWLWERHNIPPRRRETAERIAAALNVPLSALGYHETETEKAG